MLAFLRDRMTADFAFTHSACFRDGRPNTAPAEADADPASRIKSLEKM